MDDFSRLEKKLAKLRQEAGTSGKPRFLRGPSEKLIAAILSEIDETILPRRVTLRADGGLSVHLAVANRRLQALVSPKPDLPGAEAVADVELKSHEDDAVLALKPVLDALVDGQDQLQVETARFIDYAPASDVGVPVDMLAKSWGMSAGTGGPQKPLEALAPFLEGLGERAEAWLRIEGEEVAAQQGNADLLASLGDAAAVFLDGYYGTREDFMDGDVESVMFLFAAADGTAVVFIDADQAMAFVRAKDSDAVGVAQDWQNLTAL